jgi:hypothetical protein
MLRVDDATWSAALGWRAGGRKAQAAAAAVARLNDMEPGCVFIWPETSEFLAVLSRQAMSSGQAGRDASRWLATICVRRAQSKFKAPKLHPRVFRDAMLAHGEVLLIRRVFQRLGSYRHADAFGKLRMVFDGLDGVDDALLRVICGVRKPGRTKAPSTRDAIAELYSRATGFDSRAISARLSALGYRFPWAKNPLPGSEEAEAKEVDRLVARFGLPPKARMVAASSPVPARKRVNVTAPAKGIRPRRPAPGKPKPTAPAAPRKFVRQGWH